MVNKVDLSIVFAYMALMILVGLWMHRKAAKGIESYFLGGRKIPWWILALSGGVSNFDITGTMWIISLFYLMGMKAMWVHWMYGVYAIPAICMAFMGKWVRRAKVVTQAEWIKKRYGEDGWGEVARLVLALVTVLSMVFVISYLAQGIGKFFSVFLPFSKNTCALLIIGIVLVYVLLGGFYSVAITDLIQTILLWGISIYLVVFAFLNTNLGLIAANTPLGWTELMPQWEVSYLAGTPYYLFGLMVMVWVVRGIGGSFGGPGDYTFQRYAAAKSPRDASKMGALWPISLIPRWLLTMGIATLAIVGFTEVADPEKILPMVLEQYLPVGVMGLALAGLIAASMSTLDSTINAGASYAVRDIYQKFINPKATQRNLVIAGYLSSIFIVGTGLLIGLKITSIAQIWNWFILGWGAGIMVPSILGWYWWRFNAKGYIFGTLAGVLAAMLQGLIFPSAPLYLTFPIITLISLSSSILVSKLTSPSAQRVLTRFYKDIQPGGFWRPIKELVKGEKPSFKRESSFKSELGNAFLATGWITCLYSIPVYLMIHKLKPMCFCLGLTILLMIILYFTWYRRLKKSTKTDIKS